MGKITELSQGNLDGLKKQVCECIEHAQAEGYKRGYTKGKNDGHAQGCHTQAEKDKTKIDQARQEGYDNWYEAGKSEMREVVSDFECLLTNEKYYKEFLSRYVEKYGSCTLSHIVRYIGIVKVVSDYREWMKETKSKDNRLRVGDEVKLGGGEFVVVTKIDINGIVRVFHKDGSGGRFDIPANECTKTGVHYDEIETLLEKLRKAGAND